jgi:hypothetical protein
LQSPFIDLDHCLKLTDFDIAFYHLEDKVKYARFKYRDERNGITYVYDPLLGLIPKQKIKEK